VAETSANVSATTSPAETPCDKLPLATRTARSAFLATAHLPSASGGDAPVTEFKITPTELGFTTKKRLTRRERRRLRRKLGA
jgi:hypothetical protein